MNNQDEIKALNALVELNEAIQEQNFSSLSQFFDDVFSVFGSNFKKTERPTQIESNYDGIHLNKTYEIGDFMLLIESFRNNQKLHAKYALQIFDDAVKKLQTLPNIAECSLTDPKSLGIIIVGDLHGSFKDLYYIISKYGVPGVNYNFVFNGDFVDRGPQQSEVLLTLLYAFLLNPGKVFLNRGNHEDPSMNTDGHCKPNFKDDTALKFGKYGLTIFNESIKVFKSLPLGTIVRNNTGLRYFVTHGGISDRIDLNFIKSPQFNRFEFERISKKKTDPLDKQKMADQISDLLWSDPVKDQKGCTPNHHRGTGYLFGPDVSENFCKIYSFNGIIRSHQVCEKGIDLIHQYCYTIFSSSRYCGGRNHAAVIFVEANKTNLKKKIFDISHLNEDHMANEKKMLIQGLKSFLQSQSQILTQKFHQYDPYSTGFIEIDNMAKIICDHINSKVGVKIDPKHIITLKDNLCPCNEKNHTAQYAEIFTGISNENLNHEHNELIKRLFYFIDTNHTGFITRSEADEATKIINKNLGTSYTSSIFDKMDTNKDGYVDFNEFYNSFLKAFK